MSMKEKEQIKVFEQLTRKEITQKAAAELLDLSDRQVRNKLKEYKTDGPQSLVHKNRGRPSQRKWAKEEDGFAMSLFNLSG